MSNNFTVFHLDDGKGLRGGQRQLLQLVKELQKLGQDNIVVCRDGSPLHTIASQKKIKVITLPYFFEWDPISALLLSSKIRKLQHPHTLPILHSHTSHTAVLSFLVSLILPVVRIVHKRVDFDVRGKISLKIKYLTSDRVIAVAEAVKRRLIQNGVPPEQVSVIHSTIDPEDVPFKTEELSKFKEHARDLISDKYSIPRDRKWVGTLIALTAQKNPSNFISSAAILATQIRVPDCHFLIAGTGPLEHELKELAKKTGISHKIHFLGHYDSQYEFLAALDVFVLPSSNEGFANVLIQACNAKLPIITTNSGGATEIISDSASGIVTEINDPEALANAQAKLLCDADLAVRYANEAHKRAASFFSPKMAQHTLKTYEEAIENFKRHRHPLE